MLLVVMLCLAHKVQDRLPRQLNRAILAAAEAAHIDKRVSMHTLRHYLPFLTMSCTLLEAVCFHEIRKAGQT